MVIITLELWYIFTECIIKSAYLQFALVKIAEMMDVSREQPRKKSREVVGTDVSLLK